jgi:hypothetical protein
MNDLRYVLFVLTLLIAVQMASFADVARAEQRRAVPDTPASFTLTGNERWIVATEKQDGEAAIGLAREEAYQNPKVQVAKTRDGKYAVLIGPQAEMSADELKQKFGEDRSKDIRQSHGEEFAARAWQNGDLRLASADMDEGKATAATTGALTLALRVQQIKKKKDEETYVVVFEGKEDGKPAFSSRSEILYSAEPNAKASWVKLEGDTPQAVFGYYTGGAHCCMLMRVATKDASAKWRVIEMTKRDGDAGPVFEDLDGDGTAEMLGGDNRFLYQFDSYASSVMPAKIEKLIAGKIADVTRDPKYRRYLVQYLAALEARAEADEELWKQGGFLAGWVAQKVLLGEGAEAFARAKSYDPDGGDYEECTINRPVDKCPARNKRKVTFTDALRKFLNENGYR